MAKVYRSLEVEKVNYSQNALVTRQLPLTVFKELQLRLKVTHTNDGAATITPFSLCKLISKIQVTLNGQDTLVSLPFYHLFFSNKMEFGVTPLYSITTTTGAGKVSFVDLKLPFFLPLAINGEDTLLDARGLSSAVLEVQWGSSIGSLGATGAITAAELLIHTGEFSNVANDAKFARHEFGFSVGNLDSIGLIQHKLDVGGNNQYRRLFIYGVANGGTLSDAVIDKLGVLTRSFYYVNKSADAVKGSMVPQFAIDNEVGVYCLDFCPDGKMSQRLDARALSELVLEIQSLVNNGSFTVVKEKVIYA